MADDNRQLVEAALTPALRDALAELCRLMRVRRDRWQHAKALRVVFETAAVRLEADRYRAGSADTWEWESYRLAANALDINVATAISRVNRPGSQSREA